MASSANVKKIHERISAISINGVRVDEFIVGVLRMRSMNVFLMTLSAAHIFGFLFMFSFFLLGMIMHLINYLRYNPFDYSEVSADFPTIFAGISAIYMNIVHIMQIKEAAILITNFEDFRHYRKPETFDSANQIMCGLGLLLTTGYVVMGTFALTVFSFLKCENGTADGCGLIMAVNYPFMDTNFGVGRYAALLFQIFGGFGLAIITFLVSWNYITLSELLNSYMHQLKKMLRAIPDNPDCYRRRLRFRECVIYHHRILELSNELLPLSSKVYVVHVVNSPVIMSMIVYQLMQKFDIIFCLHLFVWVYATSIGCVIGQRVSDMSNSLHETVYNSIPFSGDNVLIKNMLIMMYMVSKPIRLTCGGLIYVDYLLMVAMAKTMYGYMALF